MKTAMISGITGQDGWYLSNFLLDRQYKVIGLCRQSSYSQNVLIHPNFYLETFDITDLTSIEFLIKKYQPDEFYNLAAQSYDNISFNLPINTFKINTMGVINILEAIRLHSPKTRLFQASSSEMFGKSFNLDSLGNKYQDENTNFSPHSPYGVSKLAAHKMIEIYRNTHHIFACSGILFNHESPKRNENFVTRKITKYISKLINKKENNTLKLGNLNSSKDWGHAKDYVRAMYLMLQSHSPSDYVISSGHSYTVLDFVKEAFNYVGFSHEDYVEIDPKLYRNNDIDYLRGISDKAYNELGWQTEISFKELIKDMLDTDIQKEKNNYV